MKKAFTLAETLITLGIIGIVAVLTIPSLIQRKTEQETVVKLKKAYSTLLNAYQLAQDEYGNPRDGLDWSCGNCYKRAFLERLMPYLDVAIDCNDNIKACFDGAYMTTLEKTGGGNVSNTAAVILKDGTLLSVISSGNAGARHAQVMIDVNGKKKPNAYGHDAFFFDVADSASNKNKQLAPRNAWQYSFSHGQCQFNSTFYQATGCAWWVITNGNLDYLHCDLNWDTQTKCSD